MLEGRAMICAATNATVYIFINNMKIILFSVLAADFELTLNRCFTLSLV